MLADVYIPRLYNDLKIVVQKNHLGDQILYRTLVPIKKQRQWVSIAYSLSHI